VISLLGRRPAEPADWARRAVEAAAKAARASAAPNTKTTPTPRDDEGFPAEWSKEKATFRDACHGKCAYCETDASAGQDGDIEHYRPKAAIEEMTPGNRDDSRGSRPGRVAASRGAGYPWLAYRWDNYLFSCSKCNRTWKRNQFPIGGARATAVAELDAEQPLLLNPFDVDPAPHFAYDELTGMVLGVTPEGRATIDVCGLDRRRLGQRRHRKAAKLKKLLESYVESLVSPNLQAQNIALRAILAECSEEEEYAGMARFLAERGVELSYADLLDLHRRGAF
jgi:hypothetical protein